MLQICAVLEFFIIVYLNFHSNIVEIQIKITSEIIGEKNQISSKYIFKFVPRY